MTRVNEFGRHLEIIMHCDIPDTSYGVRDVDTSSSSLDYYVAQVRRNGFAVVPSRMSESAIADLASCFDDAVMEYSNEYERYNLSGIGEQDIIRCPLALCTYGRMFLDIAMNTNVLGVASKLISGEFILNQQNGLINRPGTQFGQSRWHRDLPYQHWVASRPLAINALYCVDDFTLENGATYVLPGSHMHESFPSQDFIRNNAIQVIAKAGDFLVLDCMVYHSAGINRSPNERRAINHVYTIPMLQQQIILADQLRGLYSSEPENVKRILMIDKPPARSIVDFLNAR